MKGGVAKPVRCAIYTRVSTDQGLEQDFNSLDAQYDASQSYIRSQAHAGWTLVRGKYDDGGFSGGNTDRPALQRLLEDVQSGKVDVIVVYKVDRLTRSLADFAKLVELFDKHNVSFVSVTQQFNTTTSMGRLTLNVLLSFAQFEREVTSERIRDKIAASKRKGLWVGGMAPLGYDTKDRKITVNEAETDTVRTIFRSYLKLGSLNLLMADLRKQGIVSKIRTLKTGDTVGGIPFTRGGLAHPSHARKRGIKYRYYLSSTLLQGQAERSGSVRRIPATEIEALVIRSVRDHLKPSAPIDDRSLVDTHVARVEVQPEQLVIQLAQPERTNRKGARAVKTLRVPWHKTPSKRRREILLPDALDPQHARPIRSETRATLVASIARGRRWLNELVDDAKASVESIAKRERCSVRQVNMTISLAFVAPDLVKAAIEGRLPRGIGVTRLRDAPVEWSRQHAMLGLTG